MRRTAVHTSTRFVDGVEKRPSCRSAFPQRDRHDGMVARNRNPVGPNCYPQIHNTYYYDEDYILIDDSCRSVLKRGRGDRSACGGVAPVH